MIVQIKRVYEKPSAEDGFRILVDRLWPRGLTKERAAVDLWLKEIAPSTELRKWFDHDPEKWDEFRKRYLLELDQNVNPMILLTEYLKNGSVTLLYAAKEDKYNEAVVLRDLLVSD